MKSARQLLRASILGLNHEEERKLRQSVEVKNNSMVGFGEIVAVCRWTKRGIAYAVDAFDQLYSMNELPEDVCEEILANVDF